MQEAKSRVIEYYHKSLIDYFLILFRHGNYAMNFGYWDGQVKNRNESFYRIYEKAQELVAAKPTDLLLDAGCGLGEGSFWFAKHVGCQVIGVSVTPSQITKAREIGKKRGLSNTQFEVMDYANMQFKPNTFDCLIAIETICHLEDKSDFYQEAMRVLVPGGRLVVAEYTLNEVTQTRADEENMRIFLDGWAMPNLWTVKQRTEALKKLGFSKIKTEDYSDKTVRTSDFIYYFSLPGIPIYRFFHRLGNIDDVRLKNAVATKYQRVTKQSKLWGHTLISALKPHTHGLTYF
jgi:tocopherol O-methyltransferase